MILKLLIDFYRWLWSLPPFNTTDIMMEKILFFGALLDIVAIVVIVVIVSEIINIIHRQIRR